MNTLEMIHYENKKKSKGVAYMLWFFFSISGIYRFYLREYIISTLMLSFSLLGGIIMLAFYHTTAALIGGIMIIASWLMCFIDMFLIPTLTMKCNNDILTEFMNEKERFAQLSATKTPHQMTTPTFTPEQIKEFEERKMEEFRAEKEKEYQAWVDQQKGKSNIN